MVASRPTTPIRMLIGVTSRSPSASVMPLILQMTQKPLSFIQATGFEPQPMEFFLPEQAPARLTRLREKLEAIAACGIDRVLLIRFDERFAAVEARDFVNRVLVEQLGIRYLYVGDDFRFGKARLGDFALLRQMGDALGFGVESLDTVSDDGVRISSTRVREALEQGDLAHADLS